MRRDQKIQPAGLGCAHLEQRAIALSPEFPGAGRFLQEDIGGRAANGARSQSFEERRLVDDAASRDIDEQRVSRHG